MASFEQTLKTDRQAINDDIAQYVNHLKTTTNKKYGSGSELALEAYCDVLGRGGKRLRGSLVIEAYKMCGGTNQAMILQAARAIEMVHAYLLVIDDIQDRSVLRRGGPAAHTKLAKTTKNEHLGETLATNGALLGNHAAMMILANLEVSPELRSNVLSILNRTLVVTAHGQIADAINQTSKNVTEADVRLVQEWKTAAYSILNPLHVGMVLAGADCHATDDITPYAMALGQAFQITDDIIGTFGSVTETGKEPMDDIREGKRTLLIVYALKHASSAEKQFLLKCLGNNQLTNKDFERCQEIIKNTGALEYARRQAKKYVDQAKESLNSSQKHWSNAGHEFLDGLASYLIIRVN
ncbi:MAG: polyprenyl synthetase family protein [Candidatus Saccharibacteria bacterium]